MSKSKRYYFETTASGKQKFVKENKRSRSHSHSRSSTHEDPDYHRHRKHHHHRHLTDFVPHPHWYHHHHHHRDACCDSSEDDGGVVSHQYYRVRVEEWNLLKERERNLDEKNKILSEDNKQLQATLAIAQADIIKLETVVVPDLTTRVNNLVVENQSIRRSFDNASDQLSKQSAEIDSLQCRNEKLEKDIKERDGKFADLEAKYHSLRKKLHDMWSPKVADLEREIAYLKSEEQRWKAKFWEQKDKVDDCWDKIRLYESKLKCNDIRF